MGIRQRVDRHLKFLTERSKLFAFIWKKFSKLKYRWYMRHIKKDFSRHGKAVFQDFIQACKEAGIDCWLTFGTLLGQVRDNGPIANDYDFDVGIWIDDYNSKLIDAILAKGFRFSHQFIGEAPYQAFEQTFIKNGVNIDIFYHYKDGDLIWTHEFYRDEFEVLNTGIFRLCKIPCFWTGFKPVRFLDGDVLIPIEYETCLEGLYGKSWQVPDPHYDWHKGPTAQMQVKNVLGYKDYSGPYVLLEEHAQS